MKTRQEIIDILNSTNHAQELKSTHDIQDPSRYAGVSDFIFSRMTNAERLDAVGRIIKHVDPTIDPHMQGRDVAKSYGICDTPSMKAFLNSLAPFPRNFHIVAEGSTILGNSASYWIDEYKKASKPAPAKRGHTYYSYQPFANIKKIITVNSETQPTKVKPIKKIITVNRETRPTKVKVKPNKIMKDWGGTREVRPVTSGMGYQILAFDAQGRLKEKRTVHGVTSQIQRYLEEAMHTPPVPQSVNDSAQQFGNLVHEEIGAAIEGKGRTFSELTTRFAMQKLEKTFPAHAGWELKSEVPVSDFRNYGSSVDIVAYNKYTGERNLIDIKTGKWANKTSHQIQLSMYKYMYESTYPGRKVDNIYELNASQDPIKTGTLTQYQVLPPNILNQVFYPKKGKWSIQRKIIDQDIIDLQNATIPFQYPSVEKSVPGRRPIVFYDLETYYENSKRGPVQQVVAMSAMKFEYDPSDMSLHFIDKLEKYYLPTFKYSQAIETHGLSWEILKAKGATHVFGRKDIAQLHNISKGALLVGHNISDFDNELISKSGLNITGLVDTLDVAQNMGLVERGIVADLKLSTLFQKVTGKTPEAYGLLAHQAPSDVMMDVIVLMEQLKQKGEAGKALRYVFSHQNVSFAPLDSYTGNQIVQGNGLIVRGEDYMETPEEKENKLLNDHFGGDGYHIEKRPVEGDASDVKTYVDGIADTVSHSLTLFGSNTSKMEKTTSEWSSNIKSLKDQKARSHLLYGARQIEKGVDRETIQELFRQWGYDKTDSQNMSLQSSRMSEVIHSMNEQINRSEIDKELNAFAKTLSAQKGIDILDPTSEWKRKAFYTYQAEQESIERAKKQKEQKELKISQQYARQPEWIRDFWLDKVAGMPGLISRKYIQTIGKPYLEYEQMLQEQEKWERLGRMYYKVPVEMRRAFLYAEGIRTPSQKAAVEQAASPFEYVEDLKRYKKIAKNYVKMEEGEQPLYLQEEFIDPGNIPRGLQAYIDHYKARADWKKSNKGDKTSNKDLKLVRTLADMPTDKMREAYLYSLKPSESESLWLGKLKSDYRDEYYARQKYNWFTQLEKAHEQGKISDTDYKNLQEKGNLPLPDKDPKPFIQELNRALDLAKLKTQSWTEALKAFSEIPIYDFNRIRHTAISGERGLLSASSGFLGSLSKPLGHFQEAILAKEEAGAAKYNEALQNRLVFEKPLQQLLSVVGSTAIGLLSGNPALGITAYPLLSSGMQVGSGSVNAIEQASGHHRERLYTEKYKTLQTGAHVLSGLVSGASIGVDILSVPINIFSHAVKGIGNVVKSIASVPAIITRNLRHQVQTFASLSYTVQRLNGMFSKLTDVISSYNHLGNPLTGLSGLDFPKYQHSTMLDTYYGFGAGTISKSSDSFATATQLLYNMGQADQTRMVAAALTGTFGTVYNPNLKGKDALYATANQLLTRYKASSEYGRAQILSLSGVIDSSLPQMIQIASDMKLNKVEDITGERLHTLNPDQRNKFRTAGVQIASDKETISNAFKIMGSDIWNLFGNDLSKQVTEAIWVAASKRDLVAAVNKIFKAGTDAFTSVLKAIKGTKAWQSLTNTSGWKAFTETSFFKGVSNFNQSLMTHYQQGGLFGEGGVIPAALNRISKWYEDSPFKVIEKKFGEARQAYKEGGIGGVIDWSIPEIQKLLTSVISAGVQVVSSIKKLWDGSELKQTVDPLISKIGDTLREGFATGAAHLQYLFSSAIQYLSTLKITWDMNGVHFSIGSGLNKIAVPDVKSKDIIGITDARGNIVPESRMTEIVSDKNGNTPRFIERDKNGKVVKNGGLVTMTYGDVMRELQQGRDVITSEGISLSDVEGIRPVDKYGVQGSQERTQAYRLEHGRKLLPKDPAQRAYMKKYDGYDLDEEEREAEKQTIEKYKQDNLSIIDALLPFTAGFLKELGQPVKQAFNKYIVVNVDNNKVATINPDGSVETHNTEAATVTVSPLQAQQQKAMDTYSRMANGGQ